MGVILKVAVGRGVWVAVGGNQTIVGVEEEVGGSGVAVGKGGSGLKIGTHAPVTIIENNIIATQAVFM